MLKKNISQSLKLIKYYNLSKRTDWRYTFYHYGQEYYDFQEVEMSNGQMVTDLFPTIRYQYIGLSIDPSFAINKFQRFNYGFDLYPFYSYIFDNNICCLLTSENILLNAQANGIIISVRITFQMIAPSTSMFTLLDIYL